MRRVVIVDDNELTRAGTATLLESHPDIDVTASLDHASALTWSREWRDVDVVIVDAADERRLGDQFPGVEVVRSVRNSTGAARPTVVVLTAHYLDDGLRRRMWEADADFYYSRLEVTSAETLQAVVMDPDAQRRVRTNHPPPDFALLGVSSSSHVNELVRWVEEEGVAPALDPEARMKNGPYSTRSRWWQHLRSSLARVGRIRAVNEDGSNPRRDQDLPSITQLRRVYRWAAKTKHPLDDD